MTSGNPDADGGGHTALTRASIAAPAGTRLRTAFTRALGIALTAGLLGLGGAATPARAQKAGPGAPATPAATAPTAAPQGWTLDDFLGEMSRHREARARFSERQFLSLLDAPVDSSGELLFVAPDRLEKRTLSPRRESLIVAGDQLRVEQGGVTRTLSLGQIPEAAALIESLRATLSGDRKTLESVFEIDWKGRREQWQMQLVPRAARSRDLVTKITLSGAGADVQTVEIDQRDGDRSVMRILPAR